MYKNILLKLQYDGSEFHGWQKQKKLRTVQGTLEEVLSRICGESIQISGTSRTDAGVHALGQCCTFKSNLKIPIERFASVVNKSLAQEYSVYREVGGKGLNSHSDVSDIKVMEASVCDMNFHARFDCKGKTYMYKMSTANPNVFERNYRYFLPSARGINLDIEAMNEAATYLVGTQDFACFQAAGGTPRETTVRTIFDADIVGDRENIEFIVTGGGFLYNMVRIMAGTLIEVGLNKKKPADIKSIIESRDRRLAGHTAPACGLYLKQIFFNDIPLR